MPGMRGLTILVASGDPVRFHAALSVAAAQAALGGAARLYLHGEAVMLLKPAEDQPSYAAAGMPGLAELRAEATALGVELIVCQSGLALAEISYAEFADQVSAGGLTSLLASLGDDRLIAM